MSYFFTMKQIVEYQMLKDEFTVFIKRLESEKVYMVHGYREMPAGTIDDGRSTSFDFCSWFSVFEGFGDGKTVSLRERILN